MRGISVQIQPHYASIDAMIQRVRQRFTGEDAYIAEVFASCIENTLQKTIFFSDKGEIFVATGDIPAMWLRDSTSQLTPFLRFAAQEPDIRELLLRLNRRQMRLVLLDPYANAFNMGAEGSIWQSDKTDMKPELWERKYEIDSLCFPVQLSWLMWKQAGITEQFDGEWLEAARLIVKTFRVEQDHERNSPYRFQRENCVFTDTLSRDGRGALVNGGIGLVWSAFRPSDDACVYGYLIPSNMFASVILGYMAEICRAFYGEEAQAAEAEAFSREIREAVGRYGVMPNVPEPFYAYEVDGFGQYLFMDDGNVPSLLSLPLIGWCDADDPLYRNTRAMILSHRNPYYYTGKRLRGVGSPHTPPDYVWDIALAVEGLTSRDPAEKLRLIRMMAENDDGTRLMHEGIHADDPSRYTRPWFSWANSMYCELVMDYCGF